MFVIFISYFEMSWDFKISLKELSPEYINKFTVYFLVDFYLHLCFLFFS